MKILLTAFLIFALSPLLLADGYPFDHRSQQVRCDSLRFKLTQDQIHEVTSTGTVTFTSPQLTSIRRLYPNATNRADVITATHNDNHEGLEPEDVYCLWVDYEEIAITINDKAIKDKSPFGEVTYDKFPSDEILKSQNHRIIRIGIDSKVYFRGKEITHAQTFLMIDELAALPKFPYRQPLLSVVVSPPMHRSDLLEPAEGQLTAEQFFAALLAYGKAKDIVVTHEW